MIPIGDDAPTSSFPFVNIALIIINIAVFAYELSLGAGAQTFINSYGLVPGKVVQAMTDLNPVSLSNNFVTSIFIHGGWLHLIGNMLYLWIFGDNVEDRLGHLRYLAFYILAGAVAMAAHVSSMPMSAEPAIGASGAVAGVLGAYLIMFPRAKVFIVIPLFLFFPVFAIKAVYALGFWFLQQLLSGAGAIFEPAAAAGVAWWAHIGGFIVGMLYARFYIKTPRIRIY